MELERRLVEWIRVGKLPPDGEWEETVLSVLRDAGFDVSTVERKDKRGDYRDQDGSSTGETYSMNAGSGIAVNSNRATVWLEAVWNRLRREREPDVALDRFKAMIVESRPLAPIVIGPHGESLFEYPPSGDMPTHTRDEDKMFGGVGVHDICNSWIDIMRISGTHAALVCRGCRLRVPIPKTIITYGDLRAHLADLQPKG